MYCSITDFWWVSGQHLHKKQKKHYLCTTKTLITSVKVLDLRQAFEGNTRRMGTQRLNDNDKFLETFPLGTAQDMKL